MLKPTVWEDIDMTDGDTRAIWAIAPRSATDRIGSAIGNLGQMLEADWDDESSRPATAVATPVLPVQVLRRPAGLLVRSLGRFVHDPTPEARAEVVTQARVHEQQWHRPDDEAGHCLVWLESLATLLTRTARRELVSAAGELADESVLVALERVFQGLGIVTSVMVRQGRERDQDRSSAVVRRLAEINLALCHELRSPLYSMLLSTEVLERGRADSAVGRRQLRALRAALAHVESLLSNAAALTKDCEGAGAGAGVPRGPKTPLSEVFDVVGAELEQRAESCGVSLVFELPVPHAAVEFLVTRLALSNVVTNAIKYADTTKPERWVKVRAEWLAAADAGVLLVDVIDNGLGIPDALQSRVFQRGFRAHPHLAEGSGLGLAITRGLVEDSGGSVALHSYEGRGTTIRLRLPAVLLPSGA